jgi:hypothetical protein
MLVGEDAAQVFKQLFIIKTHNRLTSFDPRVSADKDLFNSETTIGILK